MPNKVNTANAAIKAAIAELEKFAGGDDAVKTKLERAFDLLLDAQDHLTYERAARDTLKWWSDTIHMADENDESLGKYIREGVQRIHNLDRLANPHAVPAGHINVEEHGEKMLSAEIRLTNVIKTLPPGKHFFYIGVMEAQNGEQ